MLCRGKLLPREVAVSSAQEHIAAEKTSSMLWISPSRTKVSDHRLRNDIYERLRELQHHAVVEGDFGERPPMLR